jgi:DNA-binding SARP family transcriptional activator/tetratricopeptide (TPR) repeat protein
MLLYLRITLLGPWRAERHDGQPIALPTRAARALLARVALSHPQPVGRAAASQDLFPGLSPAAAARRMRSTRYYLRRALGDLLRDADDFLQLDPRLVIVCDLHAFERGTHPGAALDELDAAIRCYGGPLLEPAPAGWAAELAAHTHTRYLNALRRMVALAQALGAPARMLDAAQRWVDEEPWEEAAHIALLQALVARNDRSGARSHLARARSILHAEWGSPNSPAFDAAARAVLRPVELALGDAFWPNDAALHAYAPACPSPHRIATETLPLIGRQPELERLTALWIDAVSGRPQVVALSGHDGIGKSRLAHELVNIVRLRQEPLVLWGGAYGVSVLPTLDLLDDAVAYLDEPGRVRLHAACVATAAADPSAWAGVCRVMPSLGQFAPPASDLEAPGWEAGLHRLFAHLLARWPLLLVLDGAARDPEQRALLNTLRAVGGPSLVVLVQHLGGLPAAEADAPLPTLDLAPLDPPAVAELVRVSLDGPVAPDLLAHIVGQSGGSPLFVRAVLHELVEQDGLVWDAAHGWQLNAPPPALPATVVNPLARRLAGLSAPARRLARLLAAQGEPAETERLEALWDDATALLAAQAELLERAVVVERGTSLAFAHRWLREQALDTDECQDRTATHSVPPPEDRHRSSGFVAAGGRRAAEQLVQAGLLDTHRDVLAALGEATDDAPALGGLAHDEAQIALAALELRTGRVGAADSRLGALLADAALPALARAQALRQRSYALIAAHRYEAGIQSMSAAVNVSDGLGSHHAGLTFQVDLYLVYQLAGFAHIGDQLGVALLPGVRQLNDRRLLGTLLAALAISALRDGEPERAITLAEEADRAGTGESSGICALALGVAAQAALALGEIDMARSQVERAEALSTEQPHHAGVVAHRVAQAFLMLGERERAWTAARHAAALAGQEGLAGVGRIEVLWTAADVMAVVASRSEAMPFYERAYAWYLDALNEIQSPALRRAFLAGSPCYPALTSFASTGPRRFALLPERSAPSGRPLHPEERLPVVWTIRSNDGSEVGGLLRQRQIARLTSEALAAGAVATVEALAAALGVNVRTIKRDLKAMRLAGAAPITRRSAAESQATWSV